VLNKLKIIINSKSDFRKNLTTLISGTIVSQIVPIICMPFLTRIYMPEDYGILGVFMAVSAVFNIVSTLNYPAAIILPKEDSTAVELMKLSFVITIAMAVFSLFIILLFKEIITNLLQQPDLGYWLNYIPIMLLFYGINFALNFYCNRMKKYRLLSISKIMAAITSVLVSLILGFFFIGPFGLIFGLFISYLISVLVMAIPIFIEDKTIFKIFLKWSRMKELLLDYKNFPKYTLPADFINISINQLPVFVLSTISPISVGFYNLSNRVLGTPTQFVASSVGDVFKQRISEQKHKRTESTTIFKRTLKVLFLFSVVPFGVLFVYASDIYVFIFGVKWLDAAIYTRIMLPLFYSKFLALPLITVYTIAMKQKEDFLLHLYILISSSIIFCIGLYVLHNINIMLLIFSLNYSLVYFVYILRSFRFSKNL